MKNPFDAKVFALAKSGFRKIERPIEFLPRIEMSKGTQKYHVGGAMYKVNKGEHIPILFVGAIKYRDWLFTLERSMIIKDAKIMICGFFRGESHCNFGPIVTQSNALEEFFNFFHDKILEDE